MAASAFYTEDMCTLLDDSSQMGVVDRTTSDVDTHDPHPERDYAELRAHKDISSEQFRRFKKTGIPPPDTVVVTWHTQPYSELIPTKHLSLYDRALLVGDVVKQHTQDAMSGTVTETDVRCTLLPAAFKDPIPDADEPSIVTWASTYHATNNDSYLIGVPAQELTLAHDYYESELIIYRDWVGRIEDVLQSVSIRLSNGSVVEVENPDELNNLMHNLDQQEPLEVGDIVTTKKGNLRRGRWIYGAYDPNIRPHGAVVKVRTVELGVSWICRRIYPTEQSNLNAEPDSQLDLDEIESGEVQLYDRSRVPKGLEGGFGRCVDLLAGQRVRFKDLTGAAMKYNRSMGASRLKVIPRAETLGFDLNVFTVVDLTTKATVLWQNREVTTQSSRDLVPDINLEDESEVWPGEIVISHDVTQALNNGWMDQPKKVGVVQSVSASDRIAKVLWLPKASVKYSTVEDSEFEQLALLPESTLGLIHHPNTDVTKLDEIPGSIVEEVILYDIRAADGLNKRRGDFVILHPPTENGMAINISDQIDWFGEVINLGLDGFLTVRLGALEDVKDIKISPEYATIVHSSDGVHGFDDDESSQDSEFETDEGEYDSYDEEEDLPWLNNDGMPISDEEDAEAWSTASESSDDEIMPDSIEDPDTAMTNGGEVPTSEQKEASMDPSPTPAVPDLAQQISPVNVTEGAPPSFAILETEPPNSHAYISTSTQFVASNLKRIQKEHRILQGSLPDGIFVRTWESRLDLLRVLIIGPLDTPYEFAPFLIDLRLPPQYPQVPPEAFFHSFSQVVSPNLYENGKICLSLLGTWHGEEKGENWSPARSTILQVLVSIMGLVLVEEPWYTEAGYLSRAGMADTRVPSQLYSEKTYFRTRGFITHVINNVLDGLEDVIQWLYLDKSEGAPLLLNKAVDAAQEIIDASGRAADGDGEEGGRNSLRGGLSTITKGAVIMLRRQKEALEQIRMEKGL